MRMILLWTLLLAGTVCAQPASYTYFGTGCTQDPRAIFEVYGLPSIGQSFVVRTYESCWMNCSDQSHQTLLFTGYSNTHWLNLTLPWDPSPLFLYACGLLLTSIEETRVVPDSSSGSGFALHLFTVPNHRALLGMSFYQQAFTINCDSYGCDAVLSRGGHGVIGN